MNGFTESGLADEAFAPAKGGLASFDAFPKTKQTYLTRGRNSSLWTATLILTCVYLSVSEISRWFTGTTTQNFSVEKGVSHDLQINLDIVVPMRCADLHVNMQDAAGDRTLAGEMLRKDPTSWSQWGRGKALHTLGAGDDSLPGWEELWDVHDQLGAARKRKKFPKTPKVRGPVDSCRIYGSVNGNKVQGDFHITARGHGYMEFGEHLDHTAFNFSHQINELSFGPLYPSLVNPLDDTITTTDAHFYKYQYYVSIVPTIYTDDASLLPLLESVNNKPDHPAKAVFHSSHAIKTNQYAVTSQSHAVGENYVPGIFVKFDIEPITLTIAEEWGGILGLVVRLVNVVSGVMVAGGWAWQLFDWGLEVWGRRGSRRRGESLGMLGGGFKGGEKMSFD
ncbi:endoplasmic reticulum vesicle transporter-domain-containing protein [Clohesyomyces aquaticus]|uniref:Endoplasmic reticulum-Golgi intermediate compartment protein n=1 Tax=Clohesyomyces aquaticus TaxID=1231657 RepID=A0A1Y1ZVX5_9PLEO|nr:endoplasmic reticulum vesicle transporter-domain-containing protein [Clohesyomyces aquaticus]